jgi:hypothetical protein
VTPVLDYASNEVRRSSRQGFWRGFWSCACSFVAIGFPVLVFYTIDAGVVHGALGRVAALVFVSAPLFFVSTGFAIGASLAARKEWITLVLAWLLVLIQVGMWVAVIVDANAPSSSGSGGAGGF